jgi:hypothetical protein
MRNKTLGGFVIGAVFATAVIGSTAWLQADNANIISACANKKTGLLRYITKGSCNKKTEIAVSWGAIGPAGPQGLKGDTGAKGEVGSKGDTGAKGESGTNGQNVHVIDASGRDLGLAFGVASSGGEAVIKADGGMWTVSNTAGAGYEVLGGLNLSPWHRDSACAARLAENSPPDSARPSTETSRGVYLASNGNPVGFKLTGTPFLASTLPVVYARYGPVVGGIRTCVASTDPTYSGQFSSLTTTYVSDFTVVAIPAFTAPFTLELK